MQAQETKERFGMIELKHCGLLLALGCLLALSGCDTGSRAGSGGAGPADISANSYSATQNPPNFLAGEQFRNMQGQQRIMFEVSNSGGAGTTQAFIVATTSNQLQAASVMDPLFDFFVVGAGFPGGSSVTQGLGDIRSITPMFVAGTSNLGMFADALNAVAEPNEMDNSFQDPNSPQIFGANMGGPDVTPIGFIQFFDQAGLAAMPPMPLPGNPQAGVPYTITPNVLTFAVLPCGNVGDQAVMGGQMQVQGTVFDSTGQMFTLTARNVAAPGPMSPPGMMTVNAAYAFTLGPNMSGQMPNSGRATFQFDIDPNGMISPTETNSMNNRQLEFITIP